jgi:hypothetical protein
MDMSFFLIVDELQHRTEKPPTGTRHVCGVKKRAERSPTLLPFLSHKNGEKSRKNDIVCFAERPARELDRAKIER